MEIIQQYGKEIFAILVPFATWALNYFFKSKAKLKVANPHTFSYLIREPLLNQEGEVLQETQIAHTKSFLIKNAGRESATKIEIVLNWKPQYFNLWPSRHHTAHTEDDGRFYLIFESLSPNETIGVELLSVNRELPAILNVRSDQTIGAFVDMVPMETLNQNLINFIRVMILLGFSTTIYLCIILIQFLVLSTN